jgi:hypothetical protein
MAIPWTLAECRGGDGAGIFRAVGVPGVPDANLVEPAGGGVSYVVAPDAEMAPLPLFELLRRELGITRLLVSRRGDRLDVWSA